LSTLLLAQGLAEKMHPLAFHSRVLEMPVVESEVRRGPIEIEVAVFNHNRPANPVKQSEQLPTGVLAMLDAPPEASQMRRFAKIPYCEGIGFWQYSSLAHFQRPNR